MSPHTAEFAFAVSLFLILLLGSTAVTWHRARRLPREPSIEELLAQMETVNRDKVALLASDCLASMGEGEPDIPLEGWQVWELIGGLAGVKALAANCDVLIALASHVQRWYPEALPIAEQLRLNAREVKWHLERLEGAELRGNLQAVFPDYAQRAAAIYYGMTQHVLDLYRASQVPGWSQLETAL